MRKLVIIPAYNEEESILEVAESIEKYAPDCDYVVINDHSSDGTLTACLRRGIDVINLPINLGIGGAVQLGYIYADRNGYDIAIQVDGDGQHDPRYLMKLIEPIEQGKADLVIGSRFLEKQGYQSTLSRRLGIMYFHKLLWLFCGANIVDPTSGFRACNRSVLKYFATQYPADYPEPESIITLTREGFKVLEVPVVMEQRTGGISSIRSLQPTYYFVKVTLAILIDWMKPRKRSPGWGES